MNDSNESSDDIDVGCQISVNHRDLDIIFKTQSGKKFNAALYRAEDRVFRIFSEGSAELSYRMTNGTKEWDTAAMQVVIEEAGGYLLKLDTLEPIRYNREDVYNREGYIVVNRKENILL